MKWPFLLLLFLLCSSCDHQESPSDDYVLVEFASQLEEDFDKLNSSENDN